MIVAIVLCTLGSWLLPSQGATPLEPSPTPDRYDDAHDELLASAFGEHGGDREAQVRQCPPIRPARWSVSSDRDAFVHSFLRGVAAPESAAARSLEMPARRPLRGDFTCAVTHVESPSAEVRFLRAPGADVVLVNGEPFVGDPQGHGGLGVPVALRAGANEITVLGTDGEFELDLWDPVSRIVLGTWAPHVVSAATWPDRDDLLFLPLFNASTVPAEHVHFHYGHAREPAEPPRLGEWRDGGSIPPLGLLPKWTSVHALDDGPITAAQVLVPIAAQCAVDRHADRRLLALCLDGPRPTWPVRDARAWPPGPNTNQLFHGAALVVEAADSVALNTALQSAARFAQQRLWERGGELVPILAQAELEASGARLDWVLRFGALADGGPSRLWAGLERGPDGGPPTFAVRATDPAAMRLSCVVEPLFEHVGEEGRTWSLP